jgi:hypothetical protein
MAVRLVAVAVVIDVTGYLGLCLQTQLSGVLRLGRRSRLWFGLRRILRGNGLFQFMNNSSSSGCVGVISPRYKRNNEWHQGRAGPK